MDSEYIRPEYFLTKHYQYGKECKDGKQRNFLLYFLNGLLILKQKIPYDEKYDKGFDKITLIEDEYILNGRMYQTRSAKIWCGSSPDVTYIPRKVCYPLSKGRLCVFNIPKDQRITVSKKEAYLQALSPLNIKPPVENKEK